GCAGLPVTAAQALQDVHMAIAVAEAIGAYAVHVLAGKTAGEGDYTQYLDVLRYSLRNSDLTILIEPISTAAMPGYFLNSLDLATRVISDVGHERLKILFDCFHIESTHGDVASRFREVAASVGHVQIASVPARTDPWPSRVDYAGLLHVMRPCGSRGMFGCESRPAAAVEEGLGWREALLER